MDWSSSLPPVCSSVLCSPNLLGRVSVTDGALSPRQSRGLEMNCTDWDPFALILQKKAKKSFERSNPAVFFFTLDSSDCRSDGEWEKIFLALRPLVVPHDHRVSGEGKRKNQAAAEEVFHLFVQPSRFTSTGGLLPSRPPLAPPPPNISIQPARLT